MTYIMVLSAIYADVGKLAAFRFLKYLNGLNFLLTNEMQSFSGPDRGK